MAKNQDIEKERLQKVLDPLLRDLAELRDHGLQVRSSKGSTRVKATVVAESFDITKQLMPDVMHDMFEGGFAVVLHYTLQGLTSDGILTLSEFGKGNSHWEVYLMYREIVNMVLAPIIPAEFLPYLEDRIQAFLWLYYLVHYPRIIERYGPLQRYWCMRLEAKHQYFKSMASKNKNFVNIGKSISTRHQLLQSYELHMYVLDKNVCATGLKAVAPAELNYCEQSLASDGQVWEVLLVAALAVAPPARSAFTDSRGNTATWILSTPDEVASEQSQASPHPSQLNLALNHLGVWQPGTSCDPRPRSLQKPARYASQLGHDVTTGTVMPTFHLLQWAARWAGPLSSWQKCLSKLSGVASAGPTVRVGWESLGGLAVTKTPCMMSTTRSSEPPREFWRPGDGPGGQAKEPRRPSAGRPMYILNGEVLAHDGAVARFGEGSGSRGVAQSR
ncbi:hypothetical protein HPB47_008432 [Ixodes persulcatus]|uniref:Uncharacterized protein n=1 Tax=Ixodes persulcatus TaxID=34615 RepID=A0AC60P4T7_IXOPE|nr:hypothetical protein HPB47_008432 [Ixodes persulcatus]